MMHQEKLMIPKRRADVTSRDINGELLILDRRLEQVHQLNSTACYIWLRCDGNTTVAEVVASMAHDFGLQTEDVSNDVMQIISQFRVLQLLESDLPPADK